MSKQSDNLKRSFSAQISELGDRVHEHAGDESMLGEISAAVQALLADNEQSEKNIREELQRQFDAGEIRQESFELVQKMLDKIVLSRSGAHDAPTHADAAAEESDEEDTATTVDVPVVATADVDTSDRAVDPVNETTATNVPGKDEVPVAETTKIDMSGAIDKPVARPANVDIPGEVDVPVAETARIDMSEIVGAPLAETTKIDMSGAIDKPAAGPMNVETPGEVDVPIAETARIDMSEIVAAPVAETAESNTSTGEEASADALMQVDIPLVATQNFEVMATPEHEKDGQGKPFTQTVRIESPSSVEEAAQDMLSSERAGDDQEFINTAVIEDHLSGERPVDDQLQVGTVLRDRFLLQQELSGGSMGTVFKALDRRLAEAGEQNANVAIKVLSTKLSRNAGALRALQQEAAKGRYLSHPNIVRFIDLDRDDGLFFIVMEWLEGQSLAQILDNNPDSRMDVAMSLNVITQLGRALDYAHQRGVIHADVKPDNVLITPDGHAKLLDFGAARIRQAQFAGKAPGDPGIVATGSPAYSSMQVLTGEDPVPADDVFSLACLLYRLVAGIRVFGPRDAAQAAADGMEPQRPQGLDDTQWRALKKALSYSRVTRFGTPRDFIRALGTNSVKESAPATVPDIPQATVTAAPVAKASEPEASAPPQTAPPSATPVSPQAATPPATPIPPQPPVSTVPPVMRATRGGANVDSPYFNEGGGESGRSPWRLAVFGAILIGSVAVVTQTELVSYVDEFAASENVRSLIGLAADDTTSADTSAATVGEPTDEIESLPMEAVPDIAASDGEVTGEIVIDEAGKATATTVDTADDESAAFVPDELLGIESSAAVVEEAPPEPEIPEFDYSSFVEPNVVLSMVIAGNEPVEASHTLRENLDPAVIEFIRTGDVTSYASYELVEFEYDGNLSPGEAGHYVLQSDGAINFVPGQERTQVSLSMPASSDRRPHRNATLHVVSSDNPDVPLAVLNITLEDAQQLEYEARYEPDTITFVTDQVVVRESDPAVQIDVSRLRPGRNFLDVAFVLSDVTATEGQDYFAPRYDYVSFGAGQETARVLIPLGQDAVTESNEIFVMELRTVGDDANPEIISRVTITILDDD